MSWLEDIRKGSTEQKMRVIWITVSLVAIVLVGLWILTQRTSTRPKDTSLFKTMGKSAHDITNQFNNK